MPEWQFGESADDGEAWLAHPSHLSAYVDYRTIDTEGRVQWRRLMVVTKAWLLGHLGSVRQGSTGPLWALLPTMLVLPDGEGEELRQILDSAMQQGGLDLYSSPIVLS